MEDGDNILDAIYEEDTLDDDVDMVDVEEGELVEPDAQNVLGQSSAGDINEANQEPLSKKEGSSNEFPVTGITLKWNQYAERHVTGERNNN